MWQEEGRRVFKLQYSSDTWERRAGRKQDWVGKALECKAFVRKSQAKEDPQNKNCPVEESYVRQDSQDLVSVLYLVIGQVQPKVSMALAREDLKVWQLEGISCAPHSQFS